MTLPTSKDISRTNDPCCIACKRAGADEAFHAVAKECENRATILDMTKEIGAAAALRKLKKDVLDAEMARR